MPDQQITLDDAAVIIGRLTIENALLRAQIARMETATEQGEARLAE